MTKFWSYLRQSYRACLLILLAAVIPAGVNWFFNGTFALQLFVFPLIFFLGVSLVNKLCGFSAQSAGLWSFWQPGGWLCLGLLAGGLIYFFISGTWFAWLLVAAIYAASLLITRFLAESLHGLWRIFIVVMLAGFWAVLLVGAAEIEGRFSNEEFYSGLEVLMLWIQWLLIYIAQSQILFPVLNTNRQSFTLPRWLILLGLSLVLAIGIPWGVSLYQHSFYTFEVPEYPGISEATPFLCGSVPPGSAKHDTATNARMLQQLVEAKPEKKAPDFALLALLTGEQSWADRFRQSLLAEAVAGNYTAPAASIKYGQYQAASRIYYFLQMQDAFPILFSEAELLTLQNWFAAINQRAQTVEPVDWLYSLAFGILPRGPYINQDIGAGLLALLEANQLADPVLQDENHAYLENPARGWSVIFRNTDDSFSYQQIWIENAWFQAQYDPDIQPQYQLQAFDWQIRLALPDGGRFNLNPFQKYGLYGTAHLGAFLLRDPRYIWLEGASLQTLLESGDPISAYIGLDQLVQEGQGLSLDIGSCLIFGSSGVPDRPGPLAPDKVVLRNGWEADSLYLLLNLRFTGWHRYKGTNSIALFFAGSPFVMENSSSPLISWLPSGRQQFRDKRIPRENLNAMTIPVQGLQAVNRALAGLRSPWAQDPPFYASVEHFETGSQGDLSVTTIQDWHGWDQTRTIWLLPEGPIMVRDQAQGPQYQSASIFWQLFADQIQGDRVRMQGSALPIEVIFVPLVDFDLYTKPTGAADDLPNTQVELRSKLPGKLDQIAVFLTGEWVGAQVVYDPEHQILTLTTPAGTLEVPLGG